MYLMMTELLSGLALFLFGMKFMSESLQKAAGDRLRNILNSVTKNRIVAVLFGALFTAIIQSSGATTVMEVGFVNAGIMSLEQTIGITFGANIGTTITSQLVSLKLTAVAPFIIFVGAVIIMFCKKPMLRKVSEIIFGFGSLFLGINFMTGALGQVGDYPAIMEAFKVLSNPFLSLVIGFVVTTILQSSSVTVSVLVLLADSGLVGLGSCLYFILGANIGSCTPAVMASFNTNKDAKRAASIHVLFNVLGMVVISAILLFAMNPVINMVEAVSGIGNAKRFVANADTFFKIFQCVIFLPISSLLLKLSKLIIRDGVEKDQDNLDKMNLVYIGTSGKFMESIAVVDATNEVVRMGRMVQHNFQLASDALMTGNLENADEIRKREKYIDFLSHEITNYLVEISRYQLPLSDAKQVGSLIHNVIDIERIGDHAVNILEAAERNHETGMHFTSDGQEELRSILQNAIACLDKAIEIFKTNHKDDLDIISELEERIDSQQIEYQANHVQRMAEGECSIEAGLVFTDLLVIIERIGDHATNVAYSVLQGKQAPAPQEPVLSK